MRERPHLASEDLSLLRFNYTFLNRRNYPLKESAWDNPDFAEGLEVTLLLKPTATVVKWTSDGNEVIAYWHQEAVIDIRSNTAVRVQYRTQGREGYFQHSNNPRILEGKELWDIAEAVFAHMITNNASAMNLKAPTYFLSIMRRAPHDDLMSRFSSLSQPVLPGTQYRNGLGIHFSINSIVFLNPEAISVQTGYHEGDLSASGNTLELNFINGKWVVVLNKEDWIS